jgi:hypothetical protein
MARRKRDSTSPPVEAFKHPEADNLMRPEVGAQAQFK